MATQIKQAPLGSPAWFVDVVAEAQQAPIMKVVELTPTLAKFMLDVNQNNRSVRQAKLIQYSADMSAGKWVMNGEPLIVSKDGNLNDGQHRCLAVIDSNTTVPATIVFGFERETRLTVDQGAMRSASDFLGMEGVHNASTIAAIARMAIAYEHDNGTSLNFANYVTSAQIRDRVARDHELADAATFGCSNYHYSKRFAATSLIGFSFYALSRVHQQDAKTFLERVCRGDGLRIGEPAHTLREKMMEGRISRDRKVSMILRAWNFHRRGVKVSSSKLSPELPFPALL